MALTPEQIRARDRYIKIEVEIGCLEDDAHDALELTRTLVDVGYVYVPDRDRQEAAEKLPKMFRKIEARLKRVRELWEAR